MWDDWIDTAIVKFNATAKKRKAREYEKKIVEKMENETKTCFKNERNVHANQQMIGTSEVFREVFREVASKEWVSIQNEVIDFRNMIKC